MNTNTEYARIDPKPRLSQKFAESISVSGVILYFWGLKLNLPGYNNAEWEHSRHIRPVPYAIHIIQSRIFRLDDVILISFFGGTPEIINLECDGVGYTACAHRICNSSVEGSIQINRNSKHKSGIFKMKRICIHSRRIWRVCEAGLAICIVHSRRSRHCKWETMHGAPHRILIESDHACRISACDVHKQARGCVDELMVHLGVSSAPSSLGVLW